MSRYGSPSRFELPVILGIAALPYLPALHRGLVSEDFIILRRIAEQPFWKLAWEQLKGPWMGATLVLFWRPLGTFFLQVQELLWGVHPSGYLCSMLGTHLISVALLFLMTRRLFPDEKWPARLVSLVFALYPLHPNSVLFIASFATVYATVFGMASLLLYVEGRRLETPRLLLGSVLCYLLSLMCYEGAFILPALLVPLDLLFSKERSRPVGLKALVVRQAPFLVLAAGYLAFRHVLLGVTLGGYFDSNFQLGTLWTLVRRLELRWSYLLVPVFDWRRPPWMELAVQLVLMGSLVGLLVRSRARSWRMLLGLVWIVAARLPFGDTIVVPGNGRYWYLASAGIGFLVVGVMELVHQPRIRKGLMAALTVILATAYGIGLFAFVRQYMAASRLVARIRSEGSRLADPKRPDAVRFLLDVPAFIVDSRGNNVAQVFAWGLSDAFSPPFCDPPVRVFPMGTLRGKEIAPLESVAKPGSAWRWTGTCFTQAVLPPAPPQTIETQTGNRTLRFRVTDSSTCTLIAVGRMNPTVTRLPAGTGWQDAPLPVSLMKTTWQLYGDHVYVWINGIDASGRLVASSRVQIMQPPGKSRP